MVIYTAVATDSRDIRLELVMLVVIIDACKILD